MRRFLLLIVIAITIVGLLLVGLTFARGGRDAVERRIAAVPAYARTYLRRLRPTPVVPTPPPVSAERRAALLQARLPTAIATAIPLPTATSTPPSSSTPLPPLPTLRVITPSPSPTPSSTPTLAPTATPSPTGVPFTPVASAAHVEGVTYHPQMWNNCGPATLAMNLSFFGIEEHQREGASYLKPNPDDKNVSPEQILNYAAQHGLAGTVRIGGDLELLRRFLTNGFPVMVETWIEPDDHGGMGHYRLITAYDDSTFLAQDSFYGRDKLLYAKELDLGWRVFNRKFIVLYRPGESALVTSLLGPIADDDAMLASVLERAQADASAHPDDAFAWFNLGTVYTRLEEPELAADAFDEARRIGLPLRMLWYQFEPFEAYLATGRYEDVSDLGYITAYTASGHEEAYYYEALGYMGQGKMDVAISRLRQALEYNPNFLPPAAVLDELGVEP